MNIRNTNLWKSVFNIIQNPEYAENVIDSLMSSGISIKLNEKQLNIVHDAYDHRIMFGASGFLIKGENTENTKIFADVVSLYWKELKNYLDAETYEIILSLAENMVA
jgi:hypothetical protein